MAKSTPHQYPVRLCPQQRREFESLCAAGKAGARMTRRARVLLLSDHARPEGRLARTQVARIAGLHVNSVDRIRKRFCQEGPQAAVARKAPDHPPMPRKIDGQTEARVVALCCGPAPEGRVRWTLSLLAQEMVRRGMVTSVCAETVRRTLKKTSCSPGAGSAGASPRGTRRGSWPRWRRCSTSTPPRTRPRSR